MRKGKKNCAGSGVGDSDRLIWISLCHASYYSDIIEDKLARTGIGY